MICDKCGTTNAHGSRFCCGCGTDLRALCPQCHQPTTENARFCSLCGAKLSNEVNVSSLMKDNVIAGKVNQSVHTNISNAIDQSVHASVVHIHQNERTEDSFKDLRCHECAAFIPAAQKYTSTCYKCGKHFCMQHLTDGYCTTCKTEQQLSMFEFIKQGNKKYTITKLKDAHAMQVTIPSIVESIGDKAFMGSNIMEVALPEGLLKIGVQAFANCKDLTKIKFPSSLGIIDDQAFQNCESLFVEPPVGVRVGKDAFAGTLYANPQERARRAKAQTHSVNRSVTDTLNGHYIGTVSVSAEVFLQVNSLLKKNKKTEAVEIFQLTTGKSFTEAWENISQYITDQKYGTQTENIVALAEKACNTEVSAGIVEKQQSLEAQAHLSDIRRAMETADFQFETRFQYGKTVCVVKKAVAILNPNVLIPEYNLQGIPVIAIEENAFKNCQNLVSVTIPTSITRIGQSAFQGCNALTMISLPFIGETADSVSNSHFGYIFGAPTATRHETYVPSSLKTVEITGGNCIPDSAFLECRNLSNIIISDNITSIEDFAFAECESLSAINLPHSIKKIGSSVFWGCSGLMAMNVDKQNPIYHSQDNCIIHTSTHTLIAGCSNSIIPPTITTIGYGALYGCNFTNITIPKSVTKISNFAFRGCRYLINISFTGTKAQWNALFNHGIRHHDALDSACKTIICQDGIITPDFSA